MDLGLLICPASCIHLVNKYLLSAYYILELGNKTGRKWIFGYLIPGRIRSQREGRRLLRAVIEGPCAGVEEEYSNKEKAFRGMRVT